MSVAHSSHPKGLYFIFITGMSERFSYYGMRAIFTLYLINALMLDKEFASAIYGNYTGLVYLTPLIAFYQKVLIKGVNLNTRTRVTPRVRAACWSCLPVSTR